VIQKKSESWHIPPMRYVYRNGAHWFSPLLSAL
jgi:hypothetical protein